MPNYSQYDLTPALYDSLRRKKMRDIDIANYIGCSKQLVSHVKKQASFRTPLERAMERLPWENMPPRHKDSPHFQRVRNHMEYIASGGKDMSEEKLMRLRYWYDRLIEEDLIAVYDPDLKPHRRNATGGWRLLPRVDSDEDLIVRVDENTPIKDEDRVFWRIPEQLPPPD